MATLPILPPSTRRAVCSHDCPDSCSVLVTVNAEGRATKVQGDPTQPVTQGFLCGKVARYLDRVYSPDRVLYPLRRRKDTPKGPRAKGEDPLAFERISWDEALDEIAAKLLQISAEHGPESILPYSYAGTIGLLGYGSMDRRFFHRLGASQLYRTICAEAGGVAWNTVYGKKLGTPTEAVKLSKLILAWGANIHGNNIHLWPFIEQARRNGAKLVVIDPYRTRTASLADTHLAIRPGTDVALALGLMHIILRDGLEDRDYIASYTNGIDELRKEATHYPPERVAAVTGLTIEQIEALAHDYATTKPAFIRANYGAQRSENGGTAIRAIAMLPALCGHWQHAGGGAQLSMSGAFPFDRATIERADLMLASPLKRPTRIVNMSQLGHALTELEPPRVHALFVYNSNPLAVAPNQAVVRAGLARPDLFTVVHEQFLTDTTAYADIVLPATTFLEHRDMQGAYGHYFVQLSEQAIQPLGEARSNVELFSALASRCGFTEPCFNDSVDDMFHQALRIGADGHSQIPNMEHITLAGLESEGHIPLAFHAGSETFRPYTNNTPLPTPSGKIEFAQNGAPSFHAPEESRLSPLAKQWPLEFLPRKADHYMNTTFANLPGHRKMEQATAQRLEIHPEDAAPRNIHDGDPVRIFNPRGSLTLTALLSDRIPQGVVASRLDWNGANPAGNNVNILTSERLTDLGEAATFYSTLVEVERI